MYGKVWISTAFTNTANEHRSEVKWWVLNTIWWSPNIEQRRRKVRKWRTHGLRTQGLSRLGGVFRAQI